MTLRALLIGLSAVLAAVLPVAPAETDAPAPAPAAPGRPNIVLVQLDDFSMDLLQTMRSAATMRARGASYPHSFVVDSLCCVSRASTFTGQYPHQTGVLTNTSPLGGFPAFAAHGNPGRGVAVRLQAAGYTTGYVGKYLNEYEFRLGGFPPPVQPGWSDFRPVFGSAYDGWDFYSGERAGGTLRLTRHAAPPATATAAEKDAAYAGTVVGDLALDFLADHADDAAPYFLQVAPYAPHSRVNAEGHYPGDPLFPAAFGDRPSLLHPAGNCGAVPCTALTTRDLPGYGDPQRDNRPRRRDGSPTPGWNRARGLAAPTATRMLRDRARMAQSADRLVQRILATVDADTYVVLTSDNGFHLGQQGLGVGKGTAYTTDSRVPLLVVGPGIAAGRRSEIITNLDLAPTFERWAGLRPARYRSGSPLQPSLADPGHRARELVFFEHTWARAAGSDPDRGGGELASVPSYVAVRSRKALLIRYDLDRGRGTSYAWEFYDLARSRYEQTNLYARRRYRPLVRELTRQLRLLDICAVQSGAEPLTRDCRRLGRRS